VRLGAVDRLPTFSPISRQMFFGPTVCHCAFVQLGQHHCHNDRITPFAQERGTRNFPHLAAARPAPKENV
jgi:hypothetical protein